MVHGDDERNTEGAERSGDGSSALWDLDLSDLEGLSDGERTKNPFAHTGDSETYFVARRQSGGDVIAKDYKAKGGGQTYNALTGLLVDAGKRRRNDPEGSLSDAEVFYAWRQAKVRNDLADDDPVPYRAMVGIAVEDGLVDEDELIERDADTGEPAADGVEDTYQALPSGTYNDVLRHIRKEHGVAPGRDLATGRGGREDGETDGYDDDPRSVSTTVDVRRAWAAAGRVEPSELDGERLDTVPTTTQRWERCEPVYREFDTWSTGDWTAAAETGYDALPESARSYVEFVAEEVDAAVYAVGVGPDREETIELVNPFEDANE